MCSNVLPLIMGTYYFSCRKDNIQEHCFRYKILESTDSWVTITKQIVDFFPLFSWLSAPELLMNHIICLSLLKKIILNLTFWCYEKVLFWLPNMKDTSCFPCTISMPSYLMYLFIDAASNNVHFFQTKSIHMHFLLLHIHLVLQSLYFCANLNVVL